MHFKAGPRSRGLRVLSSVLLVAGLAAGVAAAPVLAPAAHASALVTEAQAQAQAVSTGQPVVATADSTPTTTTTANPDGTFTTDVSAAPVQQLVNGTWTPLNASLVQNAGGSYSPALSDQPLTISGGGGTTVASMTADNRTLSLSWPTTLPAPSVSGATATYANVYPGVDLLVTADTQGGFSDDLIVHNATAAANPALDSLKLTASVTGGLVLSTDASGDLIAAAAANDPPLITFSAPQIWDSAPPPAAETLVTNGDGVTVDAASDDPAYSTVASPGTGAAVAPIPVSLSGNTITLTPPTSILTGASTVYPVYIDPVWTNSANAGAAKWTQVFSGSGWQTTTSYYGKKEDMRVGVCPTQLSSTCNGMGVAHTYFTVNLPSQILRAGTVYHSVTVNSTEDWAPSCNKEAVRLWHVAGTISSATDWQNAPALSGGSANYDSQTAAFGYPGCGYTKWDVNFTFADPSFLAADIGKQSYQTFALQAGNEDLSNVATSELYWKKFKYSDFNLAVVYNYPPDQPTQLTTSPGGGCSTSSTNPRVIGNDTITFSSYDQDLDGDSSLSTTFNLYNSGGTSVFSAKAANSADPGPAKITISPTAMEGFGGTNGKTTAFKYYYQTQVVDNVGLTSKLSDKCWILFNPNGPQEPTVSYSAGTAVLGQTVTASFSSPGCSPSTKPCPVKYVYQEGAGAPVTVTLASGATSWTGPIQVTQVGPITFTVYAADSGNNVSEKDTQTITGTDPLTSYNDGYFTGGTYPDLLSTGTSANPGLWLFTGSGNGTVNAPTDIGSLGDTLKPGGGSDSAADFKGAVALHGDFTGHHVQDVMAYYPPGNAGGITAGTGILLFGNGNASTLNPTDNYLVSSSLMSADPMGNAPVQLTAAGNASGMATGTEDLIGITEDAAGHAELDLFTNGTSPDSATAGGYGFCNTISATAPGGSSDTWAHYVITTAGNSAQLLFALNTSTHVLYESASPFALVAGANTTPDCFGSTIAQPAWTAITAPVTLTGLAQADVNHAGQVEIWDFESGEPVSYTLSGTTLSQEAVNTTAPLPGNAWALTDGNASAGGTTAATALDSVTGASATVTGNASWASDSTFATDINLDGTSGVITPPSASITSPVSTVSVWFRTSSPGVLISIQGQPLSAGATTTGSYNPILYIGTDGRLYGQIPTGPVISPAVSSSIVDDGTWHHAVLTASQTCSQLPNGTTQCNNFQSLYVDNQAKVTVFTVGPFLNWTNLEIGAGYIGGNWPNYPPTGAPSGTVGISYFNGDLSNVEFFNTIPGSGTGNCPVVC